MNYVTAETLAQWRGAIGRSERRVEKIEHESLRRYALAIGAEADIEKCQPALGHWAFFLPRPGDDEIGADGHARRGGFMPPISLPRRMFAGATLCFEAPLLLDQEAELITSIAAISHKSGRSGDLVFVELDKSVLQQGTLRISERQRFVYRANDKNSAPAEMPIVSNVPIAGEFWEPTTVNLFRFSAVTFNSHRIHYDAPYTTEAEGYPALVVQGPFTAAKLANLAGRAGTLTRFDFRAQAPLFLGQPIRLQADEREVRAIRCDGAIAMVAKVEYA